MKIVKSTIDQNYINMMKSRLEEIRFADFTKRIMQYFIFCCLVSVAIYININSSQIFKDENFVLQTSVLSTIVALKYIKDQIKYKIEKALRPPKFRNVFPYTAQVIYSSGKILIILKIPNIFYIMAISIIIQAFSLEPKKL